MQGAGCRVQGAGCRGADVQMCRRVLRYRGTEVQRCRGAVMDICRVQRQRQ